MGRTKIKTIHPLSFELWTSKEFASSTRPVRRQMTSQISQLFPALFSARNIRANLERSACVLTIQLHDSRRKRFTDWPLTQLRRIFINTGSVAHSTDRRHYMDENFHDSSLFSEKFALKMQNLLCLQVDNEQRSDNRHARAAPPLGATQH